MYTNHSAIPVQEKKQASRLGHFYGHSKHKNSYALYTKQNTEEVTFGGLSNSCIEKEACFLEVVDRHRTSRLLNADVGYHATSWGGNGGKN